MSTTTETKTRRDQRLQRAAAAMEQADDQDGIIRRSQLRQLGITRHHIRNEVAAHRWAVVGDQTVAIPAAPLTPRARLRSAVWESGRDAALDGVAALLAAGLTGFTQEIIDVSIPHRITDQKVIGVRTHRRRAMPPVVAGGIRRVHPAVAVLHAAHWAMSDRQAALIIALAVQQRLVSTDHLFQAWSKVTRTRRRALLTAVIRDVCAGAHSLGELDFAGLCRRYGLPKPDRQVVRRTPQGRVYLDVCWTGIGLVIEIDGGHHGLALQPVDDALRQNDIVIEGRRVLRIPVLGLRINEDAFMRQVLRAFVLLSGTPA